MSLRQSCYLVPWMELTYDDLAPLELGGGVLEVVEQFKYLGSLAEACSGIVSEVS